MNELELHGFKAETLADTKVTFALQHGLWLNATEVAKSYGKRMDKYWRYDSNYIEELCKLSSFNMSDIKQTVTGKGKNQGTYIHKDLVVHFLLWVGVKYKDIVKLECVDNSMLEKHIEIGGSVNISKPIKKSNILYLITDGEYTKIGIATKNATSRLKQCQTGNPKKLWIDFEVIIEDAKKIESKLHKKYVRRRMMGEWFELSKKEVDSIKKELTSMSTEERKGE